MISAIDTTKIDFWETHPGTQLRVVGSGKSITITYVICEQGAEIPEHKHPHEQIGYCFDSETKYTIGNKTYSVGKGHLFLLPPNIPHSSIITGNNGYIGIDVFSPARPDLVTGEFAT
jgi:quercetin dioxygenase-like cupin family protein